MQIQKQFDKQFYYNIISDSKRQQTTTVDYKRLINGFVLTGFASLQRNIKHTAMDTQDYRALEIPKGESKYDFKIRKKSFGNSIKIGKKGTHR